VLILEFVRRKLNHFDDFRPKTTLKHLAFHATEKSVAIACARRRRSSRLTGGVVRRKV
jgi:hypothetical protein